MKKRGKSCIYFSKGENLNMGRKGEMYLQLRDLPGNGDKKRYENDFKIFWKGGKVCGR